MSVRGLGFKSFSNELNGNGEIGNGSANGISNETGDTQEICEFIEDLVEKCTEDPSYVFHPEVVERLAYLKQENRLAFESLRVRLKKVGCRLAALEDVVDDASGDKERDPTQLDILLSLADDIDELFHTADGTAYAGMVVQGHRETWAVKSDGFCHWLQQRFFEKTNRALHSETLRVGLQNFEARSRFQGQEHQVFLRVGSLDEKTYINLCNNLWQAVEVDANGWRVVDNPPVRFRRTPGMKSLPAPVRGGDINTLRKFLNVPSDEDFVLIVCWILHSLRSQGDIPPMVLNGEMGSSKSTLSTILKSLVDPSASSIRSLPKRDADLFISASNSYVLAFDNVSGLSSSISDTLCMLSTGGSHVARELFTNQKEQTFSATIPLILNGIEEFVHRSDLADRSLFITLESIPEDERRAKTEFWKSFETEHSGIFGALLDGMAEGLQNINEARSRLPYLPRMSDFALFSAACENAYWERGTFWKAYNDNREDVVEHLVEADPLADTLRSFIARQPQKAWEGTASQLLNALTHYTAGGRTAKSKGWLSDPSACGGHLRRVAPILRKMGINVEFIREGKSRKRIIRIRTNGDFVGLDTSGDIANWCPPVSAESKNGAFPGLLGIKADRADRADTGYGMLQRRENIPPIVSRHPNSPENGNCDRNENIASITPQTIYHGDNLSLLRQMETETVDLIATDPPFNTGREQQGSSGASFPDRWQIEDIREEWFEDIRRIEGLSDYIAYVQKTNSSMAAYLCFMAVRLIEMRRVLKDTGSIYLHCDPTASYHLREVMNLIFGRENFRNEITWCYAPSGNPPKKSFSRKHDVILFYVKSDNSTFHLQYGQMTKKTRKSYNNIDEDGRRYYKRHGANRTYLDESKGRPVPSWWDDIPSFASASNSKERTGYPTQKPTELYKRIIEASSNPGDVVLDPFCGSGTTLIAAETLGRQWIGIDSSKDACQTAQRRFGNIQEPNLNDAADLSTSETDSSNGDYGISRSTSDTPNESMLLLREVSKKLCRDIAERLGLHTNTVARWFDTGNVPPQYSSDFKRILGQRGKADDQFYTKQNVASDCYDRLLSVLEDLEINPNEYWFIEPSVGSGNFYRLLGDKRIGLDIQPRTTCNKEIIKEDYLLWSPPQDRKYIVVGNPPFGLRGHLALQFINHSADFADVIAFVLPQLFESDGKGVPFKRVDERFRLAYTEQLPADSFVYPDGEEVAINTTFQIWTKINHDRITLEPRKTCNDYIKIYSLSNGETPSSIRNRYMIGKCDIYLPSTCFKGMRAYNRFEDLPNNRGYGIVIYRNKDEIRKVIEKHDWTTSAFLSTNAALNLRSSLIEDVITNSGYYDSADLPALETNDIPEAHVNNRWKWLAKLIGNAPG